ncbi:MAG: T9SS type A sorting domain-containing protein [Crocinitomicaceae bacterium]
MVEKNFTFTGAIPSEPDQQQSVNVGIYPNPASNILYLEAPETATDILIINMAGQIVLQQKAGEISIEHLIPGHYIISGQTEQGKFVEQFIKQ